MTDERERGVIAYADGLVIDPQTGELVEAPPLEGDRLAYVAHTRHGGKEQTRLWDQAIGGYDAYLKRQLEDARRVAVTVDVGGAQLVVASRYQRRTRWDTDRLVGLLQEEGNAAIDPLTIGDRDPDRATVEELVVDLIELVSLASSFRADDVRALDPARRPARWLAATAQQTETSKWIETKPVLRQNPLR
jgi:hypothetical protein